MWKKNASDRAKAKKAKPDLQFSFEKTFMEEKLTVWEKTGSLLEIHSTLCSICGSLMTSSSHS